MSAMRILFHRDFLGYTGGHGKVWDYFNHALALGLDARVYLTPASLRDGSNPWMTVAERVEPIWEPERAELLFLAGLDWEALPEGIPPGLPVINLIQHVRHADPALPWRQFLRRPAWRVCVSQAVADAIIATGEVQGDVRLIPAALNLPAIAPAMQVRTKVFIGALKNPALGRALHAWLVARGWPVELCDEWVPRKAFLQALTRARTAVLLPHPTEGFFLPGLEAMALDCAVIMPPCQGSGQYAENGRNCLMPEASLQGLIDALERLQDGAVHVALRAAGRSTAQRYTLAGERAALAALLAEITV